MLAKKLGCTPTQLSIAWTLKHEPVQCLLLSATNPDILHQNLQSLQVRNISSPLERLSQPDPSPLAVAAPLRSRHVGAGTHPGQ